MRPHIVNIDICYKFTCLSLLASVIFLVSNPANSQAEQPVAKSPVLTAAQFQSRIEADISGSEKLFLVVTDAGNGFSFDWAAWIAPRLEGAKGKLDLTELKWTRAESEYGSVVANRNNQNDAIRVGGNEIPKGIGTHANSVIQFDLPKGHDYQRFVSGIAIDDGGTSQGGGAAASIQFMVFTKSPPAGYWPSKKKTVGSTQDLDKAIEQFEVNPELEVDLFASEPMLVNPTNIDIDHRGRVWVAEVLNYRNQMRNGNKPARQEGDRILILEDTDSNGQADKQTVFYQGTDIDSVHGICLMGDRLLVSAGADVFYLIDKDGDSVADEKQLLFTKISGVQHDHGIHAFVFGPDGKLYFNFGNSGRTISDAEGKPIVDIAGNEVNNSRQPYQEGMIFRCNPDGSQFETLAWNFRNNWEVCVDSFGRIWQSDNDDDGNRGVRINYVLPFGNYGYRDAIDGSGWRDYRSGWADDVPNRHWHQNDPGVVPNLLLTGGGSPTGICIYEGEHLPPVFQGQMIHCDAGPNIVRAYPVKKSGAGFSAETVNILDGSRFNQWFRPSDVCVAPDGSLLVADWHDPGVGGHRMQDIERGRLFRVTRKGSSSAYKCPPVDTSNMEGAITALKSPNQATRFLGWQALIENPPKAIDGLQSMWDSGNPRWQARALWLVAKLDLDTKTKCAWLERAMQHTNPELRATVVRIAQQTDAPELAHYIWENIDLDDPSPAVRREMLIALSDHQIQKVSEDDRAKIWTKLAMQFDGQDRWYLEALGIAADGHWDLCLAELEKKVTTKPTAAYKPIAWRSRGQQSFNRILQLIRNPDTSTEELPRLFRSLDFLNPSEHQKELLGLILELDRPNPRNLVVFVETLRRLPSTNLESEIGDHANPFMDTLRGKKDYVEFVAKFKFKNRMEDLTEYMVGNDRQLAIDSMNTLLDSKNEALINRLLTDSDDAHFETALSNIAASNQNRVAPILSAYARHQQNPLERRRSVVRAMGKIRSGGDTILRWTDSKKYDRQLESAMSSALHNSKWQDFRKRAAAQFPIAAAKNNQPLPTLDTLMKLKGNSKNGKTLFANEGTCNKCHIVNGKGTEIGPDLSGIGKKLSSEALFESILFPSAGISHNYENWKMETTDGNLISGLKISDSDSEVQIRDVEGVTHRIKREAIEGLKQQEISLMPADLHKNLTAQQLVVLVQYLKTLKETVNQ
ncbi:MAG: NPCBM/NEW2 domain-containing protein [Mariniblastus sp.]|nr:NPCBM/NEW2 domain-containing protein [Mariniblastus sp.]